MTRPTHYTHRADYRPKETCCRGHAYTPENTRHDKKTGARICRTCACEKSRQHYLLTHPPIDRTCCRHGHPWTPENTYINARGCRVCRACNREAKLRIDERRGIVRTPRVSRVTATHCANGHAWSMETLRVDGHGRAICRICEREAQRRSRDKRKENQT